jgi:hypothetical protein
VSLRGLKWGAKLQKGIAAFDPPLAKLLDHPSWPTRLRQPLFLNNQERDKPLGLP